MTGDLSTDNRPWYSGITRYQWLILVIACLGWIFDVYEGQIFNLTRGDMLNELLASDYTDDAARKIQVDKWGDWFLAAFLLGGTAGGLLFGSLADRYGRRPIMIAPFSRTRRSRGLLILPRTCGKSPRSAFLSPWELAENGRWRRPSSRKFFPNTPAHTPPEFFMPPAW